MRSLKILRIQNRNVQIGSLEYKIKDFSGETINTCLKTVADDSLDVYVFMLLTNVDTCCVSSHPPSWYQNSNAA